MYEVLKVFSEYVPKPSSDVPKEENFPRAKWTHFSVKRHDKPA